MTSSNPVAGGACTGGGIGPLQVDEVIGVMKAYSTRVGLRAVSRPSCSTRSARGSPSAATSSGRSTGRPRRVGWFDAVPLRYAVAVNSVSSDHAQQARHPVGHRHDPAVRRLRDRRPAGRGVAVERRRRSRARRRSTRSSRAGSEPIHDVRSLADLPENARRYVSALEEHAGVPIVLVSVGPGADPDDRAGLAADAPAGRGGVPAMSHRS